MGNEKEKGVLRKKRRMKLTEKADGWGKDKDDLKWKENRRKRREKRKGKRCAQLKILRANTMLIHH